LFSCSLGFLDTQETHDLLDRKLREVNDDPDSRFCILKKRFREHSELLQRGKGIGPETVKDMIDILGTHGNYEEILTRVIAGYAKGRRSSGSGLLAKAVAPSLSFLPKTTPNGYKLDQMDDTTFLTEICTVITENPDYRQIVEEILQEATKSLGIKLKKLKNDLLNLVRNHVASIIKQDINERVSTERRDADQEAKAQLRSLIRAALDAEVDHPTNR